MTLKTYLNNIIFVLQILIGAGIGVRCILVIKKCREQGASWNQTFDQIKKLIIIGAITITIVEIATAIEKYF